MVTTSPRPIDQSLSACNSRVAAHFGMTVRLYKTVKALTQLAVVAIAFYAIAEGADPTYVFAGVVVSVAGPEALETYVAEQTPTDTGDPRP